MRTTMNIPKDLVREAMRLSDAASQTQAVIMGLEELIRRKRLEKLAALRGSGRLALTHATARRMRAR
jgi:hypothetical protein